MTRYKLDEKTGMVQMLPGYSTDIEAMDVLGKALCRGTAGLARAVGVPENEVYECKKGSIAAIEHNLSKVDEHLNKTTKNTIVLSLIKEHASWDIEYFRGKHCGTCANKSCNKDDKEVDACISDEMIREADERDRMGE